MWPTFLTLWRTLSGKAPPKAGSRRRPAGCRPRLEVLEDRTVPTTLGYSTYLGGSNSVIYAVAADSSGNSYVAGTDSSGVFAAKLNATGTALLYYTHLGNPSGFWKGAYGIAVDGAGDAYVVGDASAVPTTPNAYSQTGGTTFLNSGFVSVLNPMGGLIYATYLPGIDDTAGAFNGTDNGGIAVDSAGNVYVTGPAGSGLPTTAGAFQSTFGGSHDNAFLAKINPNLSGAASLVYCTYLGGNSAFSFGDVGTGVAVDSSGNAYLTGFTSSANFPTTPGAYQTSLLGLQNVFVAKFNPSLSGSASLLYSTYLGGSNLDGSKTVTAPFRGSGFTAKSPAIAVDSAGDAYVAGLTLSRDFPITAGTYETSFGSGQGIAFVTKLNPTGSQLIYSTYLGQSSAIGTPTDVAGIAVDAAGNAHVAGVTFTTFPLVDPVQSQFQGMSDAFIATLNATGSGLLFSTYLGGSGSQDEGAGALGLALDPAGSTYVTGVTSSSDFPTTPGAYQTTFADAYEGFVAKISAATTLVFSQGPSDAIAGQSISPPVTVAIVDQFGNVLTGDNTDVVTLDIGNNPVGGTLSGTVSMTVVDGVATFTDLSIDKAGSGYTLVATSSGSTGAASSGFTITPAAADHLVFLRQPTDTGAGQPISPVIVEIVDQFGNVIADDNTDIVTIAIGNNAGGSTLSGTLTLTVSNGLAEFDDLSIDLTGDSYTLHALTDGLSPADSQPFNITM
jgi:hypothetical protein